MPKGGCLSWRPGTKGRTPRVCSCWELHLTPETIAHLLAALCMDSVTQVTDCCCFVTFWNSRHRLLKAPWHQMIYCKCSWYNRKVNFVPVRPVIRMILTWTVFCLTQHELYIVYLNTVTTGTRGHQHNCWQHICSRGFWSGSTRPRGRTRCLRCLEMSYFFEGKYLLHAYLFQLFSFFHSCSFMLIRLHVLIVSELILTFGGSS